MLEKPNKLRIGKSIKHKITNPFVSKSLLYKELFSSNTSEHFHQLNKEDQSKKMSKFNKQKEEAEELLENVKEEAKSVAGLVDEAQNLMDRIMTSMREMVGYVEQNWFMGDRRKMVASMVGVMLIIFGISLGLLFYKEDD